MFSQPGICFLRKDGTEVAVEIGLNPIETQEGSFTVSSIVDTNELKRARSLVAAADHATSVHTLTAGVAHAREGSARIRDLVIDLLALSSTSNGEAVVFDLRVVLTSALNQLGSEIRSRARLVKQYDEIPRVRGDASGLRRVFFNLLTNAFESISENEDGEQNEVGLVTWTGLDGAAVIEVRDSGRGVPPEAIDRIFEPFYTTKTSGARTGLGLSIADGIVRSMGGEIEVTSLLGGGSTFRVKLPATLSASSPPAHFSGEGGRERPN